MKVKELLKTIFKVFMTALIIIEVALMCFVMIFKISGENPDIFGYQFYVIISPSMEPELHVGDVILSEKYTGQTIKVDDVITYLGKEGDYKDRVVTHQVVAVEEINGELIITTKGLANSGDDPSITQDDVMSIMIHKTVVFGFIYGLMSSTPGFIFLILLPLLTLIGSEIFRLAKILHGDEEDENSK